MDGLHNLVVAGKVLYLVSLTLTYENTNLSGIRCQGASDCPAWVVATANQYAKDHGKSPFVIYQGAWNVMARSFEREIIPMARTHGESASTCVEHCQLSTYGLL